MFGTYTAKDQKVYDVFLTNKKEKVEEWKIKEIRGKVYSTQVYNGYGQNGVIMITAGDVNYFTNEAWNFKNLGDGQEVIIKGKTRQYSTQYNNPTATYQPPYDGQCNYGQCTPKAGYPAGFSTDLGIFNIESVNKV